MKISINELIVSLIRSFKSDDKDKTDQIIQELIAYYDKKGSYKVTKRLRQVNSLPYSKPSNGQTSGMTASSLHEESNSKQLYELRSSKVDLSNIILSEKNLQIFLDIKETYMKRAMFKKHGIPNESKILLYGPPGTGKTLFAYVLAGELNIPVLHIYLDVLISSFLGETGRNIRTIFEEAKKYDCIIFLDEFDAIAKRRDDNQELGELKRVVTVLLQNIDELEQNKILIAATNHDHLLDKAIRRRFVYEVNMDYLDSESRLKLFQLYLQEYKLKDLKLLAAITENISGATIRQNIFKTLRKWYITNKKEKLSNLLIDNFAYDYFSKNTFNTKNKDQMEYLMKVLNVLRKENPKKFTYSYLESLIKIPDSTLQHLTTQHNANQ